MQTIAGHIERQLRLILLLGFLILTQADLLSQNASSLSKPLGTPFITNYTGKDYGSDNGNQAGILQDDRGIMYFGNGFGVLEFDGTNWSLIPTSNHSEVYSLCKDDYGSITDSSRPKGRIYVGAVGEMGYLQFNDQGEFEYQSLMGLIPKEYRDFDNVWTTHSCKEGIIFQGKYIFIFDGNKIKTIEPRARKGFLLGYRIHEDYYVFQRQVGLMKLVNGKLSYVPGSDQFTSSPIIDMEEWSKDSILLVTRNNGLFHYDGNTFSPWEIPVKKEMQKSNCYFGTILPGGGFAVKLIKRGILILDRKGRVVHELTEESGIRSNMMSGVFADNRGNLWITHGNGIDYVELNSAFTRLSRNVGLKGIIRSTEIYNGRLYVGTDDGLFYKSWDSNSSPIDSGWAFQSSIGKNGQTFLLREQFGSLLYSSNYGFGQVEQPEQKLKQSFEWARTYNTVPIVEKSQHLIGTSSRGLIVARKEGDDWDTLKVFSDIMGDNLSIERDESGKYWVNRSNGGFFRFSLSERLDELRDMRIFDSDDGISVSASNKVIRLGDQLLFISEDGIYEFDETTSKFSLINELNEALESNRFIYSISTGMEDELWVWSADTNKAFGEKSPELHYLSRDKNGKWKSNSKLFRRIDQSYVHNVTHINSLANGDVLFGSADGLIYYNAEHPDISNEPFGSRIFRIELINQNNSVLFASNPELSYGENAIRFNCSAIHYTLPEQNQFRFWLEGYDTDWSDWTNDNKKEYQKVPEGDYRFKVQARNLYGVESSVSEFKFSISPPWYRSILAYVFYIILGIALIWGIVYLNTRRLKKEKLQLEQIVEERTEEISLQAKELQSSNEKLQQLDEFKQGMTSMIVHDLKNPLNSIINGSSLTSAEQELQRMRHSGQHMLNMVMNILDVNKYEETKMVLDLSDLELSKVVDAAFDQVRFLADEKRIILANEIQENTFVQGDRDMLERVLVNMITNAIKYSPNEESIRLGSEMEEGIVRINVTDNGEGIPADKLHTVFEKFGQVIARSSGEVRSTGLGLTFCKLAVEAHSGTIGVESEVGKGTTFWFTLKPGLNNSPETEVRSPSITNDSKRFDLNLDQEAKRDLLPFVQNLKAIPIYKISAIRNALKQIRPDAGQQTKDWVKELLLAARRGDEKRYQQLINQVENES